MAPDKGAGIIGIAGAFRPDAAIPGSVFVSQKRTIADTRCGMEDIAALCEANAPVRRGPDKK